MPYNEQLVERIRKRFRNPSKLEIKKMFGGVCFMWSDHMCCGVLGDTLMARVGPDHYAACLKRKFVREMDFTGKALKGMVYVESKGVVSDSDLDFWIGLCQGFVATLPQKKAKNRKPR